MRATASRPQHLHVPHPLSCRLHHDPHVLPERGQKFHQPPDRDRPALCVIPAERCSAHLPLVVPAKRASASASRDRAQLTHSCHPGRALARAGTHTPCPIESARRMGPGSRLRLARDDDGFDSSRQKNLSPLSKPTLSFCRPAQSNSHGCEFDHESG